MKKAVYLLSTALALSLVGGCGSTNSVSLDGTVWQMIEMEGNVVEVRPEADSFTLSFNAADSTVSGKAVCNRFFGKFTTGSRGTIHIGPLGSTMMACPDMELEQPYFDVLQAAERFTVKDHQLMMHQGGIVIAIFDQTDAAEPSETVVTGVYRGTLPAADCPGIATTVTLNDDGTFAMTMQYLERDSSYDENGTYSVADSIITARNDKGDAVMQFLVGDNSITWLDADGNVIEGELASMYVLGRSK